MRKKPLFSVLIANYNNGKYLMEAIESVRQQTYAHWEIVLVDDASTDNSKELYRELEKDERIHIYYNEQNMGCGYTKRRCAELAQGELCGFLDPDDTLLPRAIASSVEAFQNNPDCVLTFSRNYVCDEALQIVQESRKLVLAPNESYFEHHDYQAENFAAFKRAAYLTSGGIDAQLKRAVDADLYFRVEEQGHIVIIDEFTYKYRRHSGSLVADVHRMKYWNLIVRHNACCRRGLSVEQFSEKDFCDYILAVQKLCLAQNEQALHSKAYKLGKLLLRPFAYIKQN